MTYLSDLLKRGAIVCCDFCDTFKECEEHIEKMRQDYALAEFIAPVPEGWKIVPFGEVIPHAHREWDGKSWLYPRRGRSTMTPLYAKRSGYVLLYATPV